MSKRREIRRVGWFCLLMTLLIKAQTATAAETLGPGEERMVEPTQFGAVGDGLTDDSVSLQKALTFCSKRGLTCKISEGKKYLIKKPIYIWGRGNLIGSGRQGEIVFDSDVTPYLLNLGISGPQELEEPFGGMIDGVTIRVIGGAGGRIIFLWRTDGAIISNNNFEIGYFSYSATSSGNDNDWVRNGFVNCIRKNLTITGNRISANASATGSEGIGLGHFDGALISNNTVTGVGDDPIAVHFSNNIRISGNDLSSVDGRIFIGNSRNIDVIRNRHQRMRSSKDGMFHEGISLLYVGFESMRGGKFYAPTNILVRDNTLIYPVGAAESGGTIYLYGPRNVLIEDNKIINDSPNISAMAIYVLPARFQETWSDPDQMDPPNVARVHDVTIAANRSVGKYPLVLGMSGNCNEYSALLVVRDNVGPGFKFYCPNVILKGNLNSPEQQ